MARLPRIQAEGAIYHVTSNAVRGLELFRDDSDRQMLLTIAGRIIERRRWIVSAYVLMTTHVHFLIETPEPDLAAGMQQIKGDYARSFNRRHGLRGHAFHARYGAELIQSERHLLLVHRYIALNPVVAGLVRRPEDWPWGSYGATIGRRQAPSFLSVREPFAHFDLTVRPREQFRAFVEAGLDAAAGGHRRLYSV